MSSCFSAYGTGAALATSERIDERSARASTSSGRATIRFSCVGAVNVFVTRCSRTRSTHRSASKWRMRTIVPPSVWVSDAHASGPEWYSGPVVMWTSSPGWSRSSWSSAPTRTGSVDVRSAPFGFPVVPDV